MSNTPVTQLSTKEIFRNGVFTVHSDHVRDAAGNEVADYLRIVPRHRTADGITGIAVLPILNGRFGLIRVFRHALGVHNWEAVRGFVDAAETPAAAAVRELREEAGLEAATGALLDLGVVAPEPGLLDARVRLFAAEDSTPGRVKPNGEMGHGEMKYFDRNVLTGMLERGEINDPCTLVCCYRYLGAGT